MLTLLQNVMFIWMQGALVGLLGACLLFRIALSWKDTREEGFNGPPD